MAGRRMFSKRIITSARFIKMPLSVQALYFHLCLNADDDGVVEAFPITRMLGSSEDEIRVLHAKGFIKILNDDLITYITDWLEHNVIRADRKINSIYKDLLLKVVEDVEIVEPEPRSDVKDNTKRLNGPSTDGIGKDRIGKNLGDLDYQDHHKPESFVGKNSSPSNPEPPSIEEEDAQIKHEKLLEMMQEASKHGVRVVTGDIYTADHQKPQKKELRKGWQLVYDELLKWYQQTNDVSVLSYKPQFKALGSIRAKQKGVGEQEFKDLIKDKFNQLAREWKGIPDFVNLASQWHKLQTKQQVSTW